jgi:membrane associated rhomboid family serine protease
VGTEPATPEQQALEYCYRHPSEETRVHCTRCGRPICPECMIPAAVGHHCPECVRQARRQFRVGPGRRARTLTRASPTRLLLGAIFVMFLLELAVGGGAFQLTGRSLLDLGAMQPALVAQGQYWRLITATFLHAGLLHLAFNAYALWMFGQFVEGTLSRAWFLSIYLVSGFLASVASYAFSPLSAVGTVGVGASGAISGLLGAFIVYNFRRRHLTLAAGNLRWALMIIAINVVFGFTFPGVDNRAHLGGLIAGLLTGALADGVGPRRARTAITIAGFAALIVLGVVLTAWRTAELRDAFPGLLG